MTVRPLRGVLITSDASLQETVVGFAREPGAPLSLALELSMPLADLTGVHVKSIRRVAPAVVLLDLGGEPSLGLALARHLYAESPDLAIVIIGDNASAELLLEMMRAGAAEFLPQPVTPQALTEVVGRLRSRFGATDESDGGMGKVFAFFSAKGGSGSTTAAANFAIEFHRQSRKKTLLVDLDAELGEISLLLGVQPQFNFVDLVQNFHRMDTGLLGSYIERHDSGVHLLSAPYHPDRAAALTEPQVRQILTYLKSEYEVVVIDTSKSFGPATVAAFEQADEVFLVATVDLPSLRNIQRVLPLLRRVLPRGDDQLRLLINRYNPDDEISIKEVERSVGLPVFATLSNDYGAVMASINSGKPIVLNGRSPYSRDIQALVTRSAGKAASAAAKPGLLGRMGAVFRRRKGS